MGNIEWSTSYLYYSITAKNSNMDVILMPLSWLCRRNLILLDAEGNKKTRAKFWIKGYGTFGIFPNKVKSHLKN